MIELIVKMLSIDKFYNSTENIEIAKGKYELPMTIRKAWEQHKRAKR